MQECTGAGPLPCSFVPLKNILIPLVFSFSPQFSFSPFLLLSSQALSPSFLALCLLAIVHKEASFTAMMPVSSITTITHTLAVDFTFAGESEELDSYSLPPVDMVTSVHPGAV